MGRPPHRWFGGRVRGPNDGPERGQRAGVRIIEGDGTMSEREQDAQRAPADGTYTLGGGKFRVKAGDALPDGAEFTADAESTAKAEKSRRGKKAAETTAGKTAVETTASGEPPTTPER
jgi:hypothetical protein